MDKKRKEKKEKSFFQNFYPLLMRVWNKIVKKTKSHYSSTLSNCYQYNQHNKVQTNWKSLTCFSNALYTFLKFFLFYLRKILYFYISEFFSIIIRASFTKFHILILDANGVVTFCCTGICWYALEWLTCVIEAARDLILSWRMFLFDKDLGHERVNDKTPEVFCKSLPVLLYL